MNLSTAFTLGRVSNLPTIWTNVLCAMALSQTPFTWQTFALAALCISFFYLAGMYLNDWFDVEWDKSHNNPRPLVQGLASAREVLLFAIVFIVCAFALVVISASANTMILSISGASLLITMILLYDWKHKDWGFSPWIMGACRLAVYLTAAAFISAWTNIVIAGGLALLFYIAGITYLARAEQENKITSYIPAGLLFVPCIAALGIAYTLDPAYLNLFTFGVVLLNIVWLSKAILGTLPSSKVKVPQIVGQLLAGISLVDAMFMAAIQQHTFALICIAGFALCLLLQKRIAAS